MKQADMATIKLYANEVWESDAIFQSDLDPFFTEYDALTNDHIFDILALLLEHNWYPVVFALVQTALGEALRLGNVMPPQGKGADPDKWRLACHEAVRLARRLPAPVFVVMPELGQGG